MCEPSKARFGVRPRPALGRVLHCVSRAETSLMWPDYTVLSFVTTPTLHADSAAQTCDETSTPTAGTGRVW